MRYNQRSSQRGKTKGGFGGANFSDRWAPPKTMNGDPVMIIAGSYEEYIDENGNFIAEPKERPLLPAYHYREHRMVIGKSFRSLVCREGWDPDDRKDCVPCYLKEHDPEKWAKVIDSRQKQGKTVPGKPRDAWAHTVVVLKSCHSVPAIHKATGKEITRQDGSAVMETVECEGRNCKHCKEGHDMVFGRRAWWSTGSLHYDHLLGISDNIAQSCKNCGGRIMATKLVCKKCSAILLDRTSTQHSDEQIEQQAHKQVYCHNCGSRDFPVDVDGLTCDGCSDPVRADLTEMVIWLKRQGEGTQTAVQMVRCQTPKEFQVPEAFKGESNFVLDIVQDLMSPFDFEQGVLKPPPLKVQAARIDVENPFGEENPSDHSADYQPQKTQTMRPGNPGGAAQQQPLRQEPQTQGQTRKPPPRPDGRRPSRF